MQDVSSNNNSLLSIATGAVVGGAAGALIGSLASEALNESSFNIMAVVAGFTATGASLGVAALLGVASSNDVSTNEEE